MPPFTSIAVRRIIFVAITIALYASARSLAQPPAQPKPPDAPTSQPTTSASQPARPDIYDAKADAKAQIAAAVDKAKRENQRVLIMFGGNWCPWCHKLHELLASDKDIAKTLLYEYQLVLVDIGRRDKNLDILKGYDIDLKKGGVPFLTVLDENGKVLANQETGSLEAKDRHDPDKVATFLDKWKARPRDAEKLLKDALASAKKEQKSVLVHLGAPWCPWCRRLDDFLARKDIAPILDKDIIDLKIDVDRMTNGKDVAKRLCTNEKAGLPWMVLLDAEGKALATADGPKGNIGYPAEPEEIAHFLGMLKKAGHRISADQLGQIEKTLQDAAAKIKGSSQPPVVYSRRRAGLGHPALSDEQIATILQASADRKPEGKAIWFIYALANWEVKGQREGTVEVFFSPDSQTPRLRKGEFFRMTTKPIPKQTASKDVPPTMPANPRDAGPGPSNEYWQVSQRDEPFEAGLQVPTPDLLPFTRPDGFSEEDVVRLVDFVRSSPPTPRDSPNSVPVPDRIDGSLPILSIRRNADVIEVRTGTLEGPLSGRGEQLQIQKAADGGFELLKAAQWVS